MKSSGGIIIALCAGVAALALAVHIAGRDPAGEPSPGASDRWTADDRGVGVGGRSGPGAKTAGGWPPQRAGGGERAANSAGEQPRRRLPPPIADARRSLITRDGASGDAGTAVEERDPPDAPLDPPLTAPDTPHEEAPPNPDAAGPNDSAPERPADVAYDGADQVFDAQSRVAVGDIGAITAAAGTMSFWLKPEWESGNPDHANFVQLGEQGLRVVKDGKYLRFEYTNTGGDNELGGTADTTEWPSGDWRYVTATWQDGTLSLYVDGQQMYVNVPGLPPPVENAPRLYIGSFPPADGSLVPPAQLAQLIVLNRSLSNDEIQNLFGSARPPER